MGFFLFRREEGHVELVDTRVFDSRNDAVAALALVVKDGSLDAEDLFIADTDSAVPVVVVRPAEEPLRIAEPASVVMPMLAPEPELEPEPEVEPEPELEPEPEVALEPVPVSLEVLVVEEAIAEAVLADALVSAELDEQVVAEVPEPAVDQVQATQSWPWDAPDVGVDSDASESDTPPAVTSLLADLEEIAPDAPDLPDTQSDAPPSAIDDAQPEAVVDEEVAEAPAEPESPARAYEAGTSDITELTCDDCIYLNTCPKKGESDPSSCGSFQWRSA